MRTVLPRRARPSTSILALATVLVIGASPAAAQSLQGNGTFTFGSGTITPGSGTTTISITSPTAVIDWTPTDNAVGGGSIVFQPTGTTATFSSLGDFAVLNRINPADTGRNIFMDGTINSFVGAAAAMQGGSVYFYSPGGFVLGANSVINVGSLVVSALPITVDGNGNFINGTTVQFGPAVNANATVQTNGPFGNSLGSRINTSNYVALVAPRVVHNGAIATGGQAALVAAEAATINFSPDGLFDIQVTTGTGVADAITIGGTISGPSGNSAQGDRNRIYAVAVPKNQLLTMAIQPGATLGFAIAGAADVDGNAIVLSAGRNITDGQVEAARASGGGTGAAGITMTNVTTTSALTSDATYNNIINVTGATTMTGDVSVRSDRVARIYATTGGTLTLNGNATVAVDASNQGNSTFNAGIWASGGAITVNGYATVRGDAYGRPEGNGAATGTTAGQAFIQSGSGGSVQINGDVTMSANGYGGDSYGSGSAAGGGTGGEADIFAYDAGSTITIRGSVNQTADGYGGTANGDGGIGGVARGGVAYVQAGAGASVTVTGSVTGHADGYGGSATTEVCTSCNGIGGDGFGFLASISTGEGGTLTIGGDVTVTTNGYGGRSDGTGGNGMGGSVSANAGGGLLEIGGDLDLTASGQGGSGFGGNGGNGTGGRAISGASAGTFRVLGNSEMDATGTGGGADGDGTGGIGRGGQSDNGGSGGTIDYQGDVTIYVGGYGGYSELGSGGDAFGGSGWLDAFGAVVTVGGNYYADGGAFGGSGSIDGGDGTAGNVYLVSRSGLTVDGFSTLYADGSGGSGFGGNGGLGTGGLANVRAQDGATLTLTGSPYLSAQGRGGEAYGTTGSAGDGRGGTATVQASANSTVAIGESLSVYVNGRGGGGIDQATPSGDGRGGTASVTVGAAGTMTIEGSLTISADGDAGSVGECFACGGAPGDGFGGTAQAFASGAGGSLEVGDYALLTANGYGGLSGVQLGGNGTGGLTSLGATNGGSVSVATTADLLSVGYGGQDYSGGNAGDGTGGTARIYTSGTGASSVSIGGAARLDATGIGGGDIEGELLSGGDGRGGQANISGTTGTITFDTSVTLNADGLGGDAVEGTGGNGTGGTTAIYMTGANLNIGSNVEDSLSMTAIGRGGDGVNSVGGNGIGGVNTLEVFGPAQITIAGGATLDGSAFGGDGSTGGNAVARTTPNTNEIQPDAATIVVRGGGSIAIGGLATLLGDATGGNGTLGNIGGNGGNATAGEVDVNPYVGSISMNGLALSATARGGNGGAGGNGGNAVGGLFDVLIGIDENALSGTLTTGDVTILADAFGGAGGNGLDGLVGGNGGNGGNASMSTDSVNQFSANAAGGTINAGTVVISHRATGGTGGAGGNGSAGAGGNGGAGGSAQGSSVQTGSVSNNLAPSSGGELTIASMSLDTSLVGGDGGAGGNGTTTGGNGGNGGAAGTVVGGSSFFGVRGITATIGDLNLAGNSTGGDGGSGGTGGTPTTGGLTGNGGDAVGGRIAVESRERFGVPDQRGTLIAGDINGEAIATGGSGAIAGTSRSDGNNSFVLYNGDATINSFNFVIAADTSSAGAYDFIAVVDGVADITGGFTFTTSNPLTLYANRGQLSASTITLNAPTFVPLLSNAVLGAESDPASTPGTFSANSFDITTGGDFTTSANLDSVSALTIVAPGSISANNLSSDAGLTLDAQGGGIAVGNVDAGDGIDLSAAGDILAGDLTAGAGVSAITGGAITLGNVSSGGQTYLSGDSGVSYATINAANVVILASNGAINGGAITSDSVLFGAAGDDIVVGDLVTADDLELLTPGNITVGTVVAGGDIVLEAGSEGGPGGNVTGGDLTAGDSIEVLAGGNVVLGNLSAGLVNPSDDPEAAYNIGVLAGGSIQTGTIDAANNAGLASPGTITAGAVNVGNIFMVLGGDDISLGAINAGANLYIADFSMAELGGTLGGEGEFDPTPILAATPVATGGDILINGGVSAGMVQAAAGGNFTSGRIDSDSSVDVRAGGNILVNGDVNAETSLTLVADGSITARDLTAFDSVLVDAGGAVVLRDIYAGSTFLSDQEGPAVPKNIGPGTPVEVFSGSSITIDDIFTDGYVGLYAAGSLTVDTIDADHDIVALAGTDASFGTITTPETFTFAGYGNFASLFTPAQTFDPSLLFTIDRPVSSQGDATFNGPVSAEVFTSFVGRDTTIGQLTAGDFADITSGRLITLNGAVSAPSYIGLTSGDIAIGSNASVAAEAVGFISTSADGTFIGDNLAGTGGYRLSQAELNRVDTDSIEFEVSTDRGARAEMTIGDLTLDMTSSANEDVLEFWIGDNESEGSSGIIRVLGDAVFRVRQDQEVSFEAGTFALDAATGSVSLLDGQGNLSGYLGLYAPNIFVASTDILARLEVDPQYAGYVEDLNAPAAVQRPEGVLRAASIEIDSFFEPLANILVQNTGTQELPAGFVLTDADIADGESELPLNSVNLVLNGQIVTPAGTITGVAVRDLLVSEFGTEAFLPQSTINGCLLSGSCSSNTIDELTPSVNLTPATITLITNDPLGESPFGNEPDIDDSLPGDLADLSSPIAPPQPLFDTTPLNPTGDVNDPVSGSGNPSLYGLHSDDDDDDDDDKSPAKAPDATDKGGTK